MSHERTEGAVVERCAGGVAADVRAAVEAIATLRAASQRLAEQDALGRIPLEAIQALVTVAAKAYRAACADAAPQRVLPVAPGAGVSATEAAVLASGLLEAVDMDVFELQIWRSLGRA